MKSKKKSSPVRITKTPKSFSTMTIDELRKLSFPALFTLFAGEVRATVASKKPKKAKDKKVTTKKSMGKQLREAMKRIVTPGTVTPEATTNETHVVEEKVTKNDKQSETVVFSRDVKTDSE